MENAFGKKLTYTYVYEIQNAHCGAPTDYERAVYPEYINYPNGHYRVKFVLDPVLRTDYSTDWTSTSTCNSHLYERKRLSAIEIHNTTTAGNWSSYSVIRRYNLTYANLMPGYTWSGGGKTFTLASIQEVGSDGASTLPATTFTYGDNMHLTQSNNGYGGRLGYTYDYWHDIDTDDEFKKEYNFNSSNPEDCQSWDGSQSTCESSRLVLTGEASHDVLTRAFHPGAVFKFNIKLQRKGSGTITVPPYFGFHYYSGGAWRYLTTTLNERELSDLNSGVQLSLTSYLVLPSDAAWGGYAPDWVMKCSSCYVDEFDIIRVPTRYRVTEKTATDLITGQGSTIQYQYDGAATNDPEHSYAVSQIVEGGNDVWLLPYQEERGHAVVRQLWPSINGSQRVVTTWYGQDDKNKGLGFLSVNGEHRTYDSMDATNYWNGSLSKTQDRVSGDYAIKGTNPSSTWTSMNRSTTFPEGTAIFASFRMGPEANGEAIVAMRATDGKRWGIYYRYDEAIYVNYYDGVTYYATPILIPAGSAAREKWYDVMLVIDSNRAVVRLWPQGNPMAIYQHEMTTPASMAGKTWQGYFFARQGSAWLDNYSEQKVYSISHTAYEVDTLYPNPDLYPDLAGYMDLAVNWIRPAQQTSLSFSGDATSVGTRVNYYYDTNYQDGYQYGNVTHSLTSALNSDGLNFTDDKVTVSGYYPNITSGNHIVGLPAWTNGYQCPSNSLNGACKAVIDAARPQAPYYGAEYVLTSVLYIYGQTGATTTFAVPPAKGWLSQTRTYLRYVGYFVDPRLADVLYSYDSYGNLITEKSFADESTWSIVATTGAREVNTCYGDANKPAGCTTNTYYTFPMWTKSSPAGGVTLTTTRSFNTTCAAQGTEYGPNGSGTTVTAYFDPFCRLSKVVKPGDSYSYPTLQFGYYDFYYSQHGAPYMVDIQTRQTAGAAPFYSQRRFYNGLGQLLQTQNTGAQVLGGGNYDMLVDYAYDVYGRVSTTTESYAITGWSGSGTPWRGQSLASQPKTTTEYDLLDRTLSITTSDGAHTSYEYFDLQSTVTDPNEYVTTTKFDVWGRTTEVIPAAGTRLVYSYSDLARLISVTERSSSGSIQSRTDSYFDYIGNKIKLKQESVWEWLYTYNAVGEMIKQVDPKRQVITMSYDNLGRLKEKSPTSPSLIDTFDTKDTSLWAYNSSYQTVPSSIDENKVVRNYDGVGGGTYNANFYRSSHSISSGDQIQLRFKVSSTTGDAHFSIEDAYGQRFGIRIRYDTIQMQYTTNGSQWYHNDLGAASANVWYVLQIRADDVNGFTLTVCRENSTTCYEASQTMLSGRNWRFHHWIDIGTAYLDDYQEFTTPTTYTYDNSSSNYTMGRLYQMDDATGYTRYTYDSRGRITQQIQRVNYYPFTSGQYGTFNTGWTYNSADQIVTMRYPDGEGGTTNGEVLQYTYDMNAALESVFTSGSTTYAALQYDSNGRPERTYLRNNSIGLDYNYYSWTGTYPNRGRLSQVVDTRASKAVNLTYTYDGNGNILTLLDGTNSNQKQCFEYDAINRLTYATTTDADCNPTQVGTGNYDQVYTYNTNNGNLASKTGVGSYSYGDGAHKHAVTSTGIGSYSYDANGNMIVSDRGDTYDYNFTYDLENHMVAVGSQTTAKYFYDGAGARVLAVEGVNTTVYIGKFFEWLDNTSQMKKHYLAGNQHVAVRTGTNSTSGNTGLVITIPDHLGSTVATVDAATLANTFIRYYPWGEPRPSESGQATDRLFTGQLWETGLKWYFYQSRYYDPLLGRFAQPDTIVPNPFDPVSFDRYQYVRSNPLNFIDPSGHWDVASAEIRDRKADTDSPIADAIAAICQQMGCDGPNVGWIRVNAGFAENLLGYDPGIVVLPYHINPGGPDDRFPWEGAANVAYNEHGNLHPFRYVDAPKPFFQWMMDHWIGDTVGIIQTMVNRTEYIGPKGEKFACYGQSVNSCAMNGGYAASVRYLDDAYYQFYFVAFAVLELGVRVDQPYPYFAHQDLNEINGYDADSRNSPKGKFFNESTGFGPTWDGIKDFYVSLIPGV